METLIYMGLNLKDSVVTESKLKIYSDIQDISSLS